MGRCVAWAVLLLGCVEHVAPARVSTEAADSRCPAEMFATELRRGKPPVEEVPVDPDWEQLGAVDQTAPYPTSPVSSRRWPAVAGLDGAVATALTDEVIGTGLDVRGLQLREVEIEVDTLWDNRGKRRRAVGFVRREGLERPMVLVRGAWYTATAIGPAVDLAGACRARLDIPPRPTPTTIAEQMDAASALLQTPATRSDDEEERCPALLPIPPLVEAGEAALARAVASRFGVPRFDARARADRALTAHMRGDDGLARQEAAAWIAWYASAPGPAHLARLANTMTALLADQERRLAEPRAAPAAIPETGLVPRDLLPSVIDGLQDIAEAQMGQPGGVAIEFAFGAVALIRVGPAVVPALLDVLESDERLTRSVEFWRDFGVDRHVVPVWWVAHQVLRVLFPDEFDSDRAVRMLYGTGARERARELARWLRPQLLDSSRSSPAQLALEQLYDPSLDPALWRRAASQLVGWGPIGERRPLQGEALWAADPPVDAAILTRARDALSQRDWASAHHLAMCGVAWDGVRHPDARSAALSFLDACLDEERCPSGASVLRLAGAPRDELVRQLAVLRGCERSSGPAE